MEKVNYRFDIQGLRALAFLLVFIFHLNSSWLPGGFLGVDLFFVISGYLITGIIVKEIETNRFSFTDFYFKRAKRIIPAYYAFLIITALLCSWIYLYSDLLNIKGLLLRAGIFIINLTLSKGDSYFGAKLSENPTLHTWSLAVEMQFYLFLPFIVYFFRKYLLQTLISITVLFTVYATYQIELGNKSEMYFSLISRTPEFLIGAIYAVYFRNGIDISRIINNLITLGSLIVLLACSFFITEESYFPGVLALLPCIAAANILAIKNNFVSDWFSKRIPVYIGELSYSLYLWHWPIIAFIRYRQDSYDLTFNSILIVVFATFIMAWLSYTFVESYSRKITNLNFLKIFAPLGVLFIIFCFLIPKTFENKKIPSIYSERVFGSKSHDTKVAEKLGATDCNDKILLIGDSHAWAVKCFFDYIGKRNCFSYRTLTCDSFIAIAGINEKEITQDKIKYYKTSRTLVGETKRLIQSSNIILVNITIRDEFPSVYSALDKLASSLKGDQKLVLINTFPIIDKDPLRLNKGYVKNSDYEFKIKSFSKHYAALKAIANKYENVYVYDLNKTDLIFKTPGYINDTVAYYDKNHINTFAALKLAKVLEKDFMKFFNEKLFLKTSKWEKK